MPDTIAAIVVAAGTGERAGTGDGTPKQFRPVAGRAILARAVDALLAVRDIDTVSVVIGAGQDRRYDALGLDDPRIAPPVEGGETRQASVLAGLEALAADPPGLVLIHDAARPFADPALIGRVIEAALETGAAVPALAVTDTVKLSPDRATVNATLDRDMLFAVQTPQGFAFEAILDAHRRAAAQGATTFTDDAAIAEWAQMTVRLVEGDPANIKLTWPADFAAAERRLDEGTAMQTRVATGYDVHAFGPGDHVMLGGVRIGHDRGLEGHSDADVALHALTDAIFGALAEGDIGTHFSPGDPQWSAADSAQFLAAAVRRVAARNGRIAHLDVTVVGEAPKIAPHAEAMRARIAGVAGLDVGRVSVKATTTEGLGFTGRREGLAATATATVELPADG